jgi:hypothetical protein
VPTIKHPGFHEEFEWRLIYLPPDVDPKLSNRHFYTRANQLVVPYFMMGELGANVPKAIEILLGPSPNQALNARSFEFLRNRASLRLSQIPFRS